MASPPPVLADAMGVGKMCRLIGSSPQIRAGVYPWVSSAFPCSACRASQPLEQSGTSYSPSFLLDAAWKTHTERREAGRRRRWSGREVIRARPDVPVDPQGPEKSDRATTEKGQSKDNNNIWHQLIVSHFWAFLSLHKKGMYLFRFLGNASPFELKVTLLGCNPNLFF